MKANDVIQEPCLGVDGEQLRGPDAVRTASDALADILGGDRRGRDSASSGLHVLQERANDGVGQAMVEGPRSLGAASRDTRTSEGVLLEDGGPIIRCRPVRGWGGTGTGPQERPGEPWCPDFEWDSLSGGSSDSGHGDSDSESEGSSGSTDSDRSS